MKNLEFIFCLAFFWIASIGLFAQNANDFEFEIVERNSIQTVIITGYNGSSKNLVIPETINGIIVTELSLWSARHEGIKTIGIPSGIANYCIIAREFAPNLESVNVSESNEYFSSIDGILYDKSGKTLLFYPYGRRDVSFTVPQGVETIGGRDAIGNSPWDTISTFNNSYLETIVIPSSVKRIETCAFAGSVNLTNIVFEDIDNVYVDFAAFMYCENIDPKMRAELERRFGRGLFGGPW